MIVAPTIPNCVAYDPALCLRTRRHHSGWLCAGCIDEQQRIFYYITCMNENYVQPAMPEGVKDGILRGMYLATQAGGQG